MFCYTRIIFALLIFSFFYGNSLAQVKQSDLKPLLPAGQQQKIEKAEIIIEKGKSLEAEAIKIKNSGADDKETAKNEKKYNLKRLEASQFYQKGNYDLFAVLKDNVSDFWKKNKGIIQPDIKNKEDKANELFRRAKSLRKVAEDLVYPDEKLVKILEAEENEKEAIETMVKVLYAYLNPPIAYDTLKPQAKEYVPETAQKSEKVKPEDSIKNTQVDSSLLQKKAPEPTVVKKDSLGVKSTELQQVTVVAPKDTVTKVKVNSAITSNSGSVKNPDKPVLKPKENTSQGKDTSSLYNMVSINEDQVDMFNKFLQTEYPQNYENYIVDFQKLDYSNVDSLRSAWYKYLYAKREEPKVIAKQDSLPAKDTVTIASVETQKNAKNTTIPKNAVSKTEKKKKTDVTKQTKVTEKQERENLEPTEPASGFVFRVQISACRIPMDQQSLKSIYSGELSIKELQEEGWYKYAIGEFNTYKQARQLRDKLKVPGAFVIAYLNGKRIKILTSMTGRQEYGDVQIKETSGIQDLVFKVQISASKVPLKKNYIDNIYSGSQPVEEISEDGWYKYVVSMGNSFNEAKKFIEKENIPGAFIIAYYKGSKTELKEALKLLRKSRVVD